MRKAHLTPIVISVLALGVLAAGCGGNDDTAATATTAATTTTTSGATTTGETTTGETTTTGTEGASPEDVYNACINAIKGTAAEQIGQPACEQARNAFEQCAQKAEKAGGVAADTALGICRQAADQAIQSLESSSGG